MVALDIVHASNSRLRDLGPGLVAIFVGATSGIGEATLKAFVQNTISPRVYIVGRSTTAAERIKKECQVLNKDGKVEFLKADVTELSEVDRICKEIVSREQRINLLVQSQGNLTLRGRDESPEGLDRKFALNYYSRMRFVSNLLPLLRTSTTTAPSFSRVLSILSAGSERPINLNDLDLKSSFSRPKCANHSIVMQDFMIEEFASRDPAISFIHASPGAVNTPITRELPVWLRVPIKLVTPLLNPFLTTVEETGQRQLFIATSGMYPPAKPVDGAPFSAGVAIASGQSALRGSNGNIGSGGYIVNWNGDITGKESLLTEYRQKGVGKTIWEHTFGIFEKVEKINKDRAKTRAD